MRALVQRVLTSKVVVNNQEVSSIDKGLLVFLGVEKGDNETQAEYLARKVSNLRIFEDDLGKMNLSVQEIKGSILVVSQFTLAGDTGRGNRPGFENAAEPQEANRLYEYFNDCLRKHQLPVKTGIFQADMKVHLINDGPVTFLLEKK